MKRFWDKVEKTDDCWLWIGAKTTAGYGSFGYNGVVVYAHRMVYELEIGSIPDGMCVCHRCDNPPCVNPKHLFLGSHSDNMADSAKKDRNRFGAAHHNAKLNDVMVCQIHADYAIGKTQRELAKEYDVDQSCINKVIRRRSWRRVTHEVSEA